MRFIVMVRGNEQSEAGGVATPQGFGEKGGYKREGVMPTAQDLAEMGAYNEELVKAGFLLGAEGLHPSSRGARVRFSGTRRTVVDGPFAETKELIAGFWLFQVKSLAEAIEWVKRCPNPFPEGQSEIEIRQVFEADDFGAALTPEIRKYEEKIGKGIAKNAKKAKNAT